MEPKIFWSTQCVEGVGRAALWGAPDRPWTWWVTGAVTNWLPNRRKSGR